LSAIESLDDLG